MKSSDITVTDLFCGAGGSSTGAVRTGARVVMAANHWKLAIETHSTNHPNTEHDCADLRQTHPSLYPRTDILWISPECTNHSLAKGRKRKSLDQLDLWGTSQVDPAEERSRATMREVVEFTEYHRYEVVIVENVVDIRHWQHYEAWLREMTNLGYKHKALYLNAQFFGVPQSRDRIYVVFWKKGNKAPDLDFRPAAVCEKHGQIAAVQAWKKPGYPWGRYGKRRQYVYVCPHCGAEVMPFFVPAAQAIDWSLPSEKIGDRKRPLKEKTIQRILAGLRKFGDWPHIADLAYADDSKATSTDIPFPTQTTRQTLSLVQPFIASQHLGREAVRGVDRELPCITTMNNEHTLVTPPPPFLIILKNSWSPDGTYTLPPLGLNEPLSTIVASASQHALVTPFVMETGGVWEREPSAVDEPLPTQLTRQSMSLITPFVTEYHRTNIGHTINDPLSTIEAGANHHGLVTPPIIMTYNGFSVYASVDKPMPTIPSIQHHALLTPEDMLPSCGFRMLEPHELQRGMSFPDSYVILGSKRDKVKQIGNAVAVNVAQAIVQRCVESLA